MPPQPKLLDRLRAKIRLKHYSIRTEEAYAQWVKRFILFHGKRHPRELPGPEVEAFLSHLATEGGVAASTQNQARSAILFLYKEVLGNELPWLSNVEQARKPRRLPVVLTEEEVRALLGQLQGLHWLVASLMYGAGLRLMEVLRLRVKDVEFRRREILVREDKGFKDRVTMLPNVVAAPLKAHLEKVRALHEKDLAVGRVYDPASRLRRASRLASGGHLLEDVLHPAAGVESFQQRIVRRQPAGAGHRHSVVAEDTVHRRHRHRLTVVDEAVAHVDLGR
jgi:site-specific recombinase XerD